MHFPKNMAILITALTELSRPHDTFTSTFGTLSDRNNQGMDMRAALIKMNLEADDIFLSVPFGAPVIDIFCPLFDFRTSLEMAVICTLVQIYGLGSKCHLKCTVMIASEDKFRTTVWLNFAVRLERLPAQFSQPFLQTDFKRFLLISQRMNFPIGPNLEIQFHSGLVIVIGRILILAVNLVVIPMSFVLIRLCCAERLSGFDMHGLFNICVHIGYSSDK